MPQNTDLKRCPLCGGDNACAQAGPSPGSGECWCFSVPVSPGEPGSLPGSPGDQACLCPHCLQQIRNRNGNEA